VQAAEQEVSRAKEHAAQLGSDLGAANDTLRKMRKKVAKERFGHLTAKVIEHRRMQGVLRQLSRGVREEEDKVDSAKQQAAALHNQLLTLKASDTQY